LANAAIALAYFGGGIGAVMALVDRALALNPSFARGWFISGLVWLIGGYVHRAVGHTQNPQRLESPQRGPALLLDRCRSPVQPSIRGSASKPHPGNPRRARLPGAVSPSRCLLRPYGTAR